jgi:hypothetical protein
MSFIFICSLQFSTKKITDLVASGAIQFMAYLLHDENAEYGFHLGRKEEEKKQKINKQCIKKAMKRTKQTYRRTLR